MTAPDHPQTIVYYDGWCNACIKSAQLFTKLDHNQNLLICIDFRSTNPDRQPLIQKTGVDTSTLATSLHTLTPDGTLHSGPEAIRQAMNSLGKAKAIAWTRYPIINPILNTLYKLFARNRLRWFANHKCKDGSCQINTNNPQS